MSECNDQPLAVSDGQFAGLDPITGWAIWEPAPPPAQKSPTWYSPTPPRATAATMEAGLCRAGGLQSLEKVFSDQVLSAADQLYSSGGASLLDVIEICARQNGWENLGGAKRDLWNAMKAAFRGGDAMASFGTSTISASGILSNVGNKFLKESFLGVEIAWRTISAIRPVKDFKEITSYSLTGGLTYDKVAPGGQLKHGELGEEKYTNQADTYGRILGLDRRDLINDDLGAFTKIFKLLGRGGALKLNQVFWTEWMADAATFWSTANANYATGAGTAFGNDGLTAADALWAARVDPDGEPMGDVAKFLLVPSSLRIPAVRMMSSQYLGDVSDKGDKNPWSDRFTVVSSVYLSNANYTGNSSTAWWLLADPNDIAVIETCFLDGREMPVVESVALDSSRLGLGVRAYHDFGCRKQEPRGGLKLRGT